MDLLSIAIGNVVIDFVPPEKNARREKGTESKEPLMAGAGAPQGVSFSSQSKSKIKYLDNDTNNYHHFLITDIPMPISPKPACF